MSAAKQLKEEGNQCFKEKRYNKAILHYTSSLEKELDYIVLGNRAQCFINLKIFDLALMDCNRALELEPNYIKGLFRRAVALEAIGLITAAEKDIERLLKLTEDNAAKSVLDRLKKKHDIPCVEVSVCEKGDEIRSSTPLQNIKIDCDHADALEDVPCSSNNSDAPALQNLSLCKSPASYSDVVVDFSLLRNNPSLFVLYFMKISPALYHRLFDDVLDVEVLSCLLKGLSLEMGNKNPHIIDSRTVCSSLLSLSEIRRFDMLVMFLSAEDKKNLYNICEHLPNTEAQLILAKYTM